MRVRCVRVFVGAMAAWLAMGAAAAADDPWRVDLEALMAGLARNYANFAQQVTDRRVDE